MKMSLSHVVRTRVEKVCQNIVFVRSADQVIEWYPHFLERGNNYTFTTKYQLHVTLRLGKRSDSGETKFTFPLGTVIK